jgi:hypothetical protein
MSDEQQTTTIDPTAAALIEQVWGTESGPSTGPADEAVETTETSAPIVEPKVEEPVKDERAERVAGRIALAKRAELRAANERKELTTARAAQEKQAAELAERAKQLDALEAAKLSPSKLLELYGKSPKDFLEALANEHEPDAVAKRAMAGTVTEVQKLQARIDAMEQAERSRVAATRQAEIDRETQTAGASFVDFVAENHAKYPALVETMTPTEFVNAGFAILQEVVGKDDKGRPIRRVDAYMAEHNGEPPTHEEIAEYLEWKAKPRFEEKSVFRTRVGQKAATPGEGTPNGQASATQTESGSGPRTLTSRDASIKASAPKPWSQEAADEESLRILRAAMR